MVRIAALSGLLLLTGCEQIIGLGDPMLGAGGSLGGAGGEGGAAGGAGGEGGTAGTGGSPLVCDGCTGDVVWSRSYGTSGNNSAHAVTMLGSDAVIAVATDGEIDFSGTPTMASGDGLSIALARIDGEGAPRWDRRFAAAGDETPHALATLPDGDLVLVGQFDQEVDFGGSATDVAGEAGFVVRFDGESGIVMWYRVIGGPGDEIVFDVAVSASGRIAIIGEFDVEVFGTPVVGDVDVFVAEIDPDDGDVLGHFTLASPAYETGRAIGFTDDRVIIAGDYETTLDIGGTILPNASQTEVFVAAMNLEGDNIAWATSFGGNNYQHARSLAVRDGNFALGGSFQSELRFGTETLLAEYQAQQYAVVGAVADGITGSATGLGELANNERGQRVAGVAWDAAGHLVVGGRFRGLANIAGTAASSTDDTNDVLLAKLAADGTAFWSQSFGGSGRDQALDVATDGEQSLLVGELAGQVTVGAEDHDCPATRCAFLVRFAR